MAKYNKLVGEAEILLDPDESLVAAVDGIFKPQETSDSTRGPGVLLLTNQRILFYRKTLTGYLSLTISFDDLSSVDLSKTFTGHRLTFSFKSGRKAQMSSIQKGDPQSFLSQDSKPKIAVSTPPRPQISDPTAANRSASLSSESKHSKQASPGWRAVKYVLIGIGGLFLLTILIALVGAIQEANEKQTTRKQQPVKQVTLPEYTIHRQRVSDSRTKTQVVMEIIVPDCADRTRLRALMEHLYNDAAQSTGYKLRRHPNAVYIRLWRAANELGRVMPLARVDKHVVYDRPAYIFHDDRLAALNLPADYLGMTEAQRRAVWDGYKAIVTKHLAAAKRAHPETTNPFEWVDHNEVNRQQAEFLAQLNISDDEFNKIYVEGQGKGWPEEIIPQ